MTKKRIKRDLVTWVCRDFGGKRGREMKEKEVYHIYDDYNDMHLAIFEYDKETQEKYKSKKYEVCYMLNQEGEEYNSFGGSVGYTTATFDSIEEAKGFINKGLLMESGNPDIWLEMVEV